ncbi:MAG TPA: glycosyltransferase, partial [Phototrophicaceae bacterium]|nr:glycosyltransferase [Phototrophicaceae bacterium]
MSNYNLILALTDSEHLEDWLTLAKRLLPTTDGGEIHLRGMVCIEANAPLTDGVGAARTWRDKLYHIASPDPIISDQFEVYVDHQPIQRVLDELNKLDADLLLVQWQVDNPITAGMELADLFEQVACDLILLSEPAVQKSGDVLLSLRGGPNITLGLRLAMAMTKGAGVGTGSGNGNGEATDSSITLFHAADSRRSAPDLELMMRAVPQITRTVTAVTRIASGIAREAGSHKAVVMGASFQLSEKNQTKETGGTPIFRQVYNRVKLPLALVRGARQEAIHFHIPLIGSPNHTSPEPINVRVDRWFAENTFHSREFNDLAMLQALKEKQGITISIALPALNEEKTVGKVIQTLKQALMEKIPLVDEIVLIDSNSTDNTA